MLHFLPAPLLGSLCVSLVVLNTVFWCIPFYVVGATKVVPSVSWRDLCARVLMHLATAWVACNNGIIALTQKMEWDVRGVDGLPSDDWYLVSSNHRSWADIVVLQKIFHRKIPFLKFFLKKELIWVPLLGLAWKALDFPFMRRYSREVLEKRPELRGADFATTRRACERFARMPTTILNFAEGTRFSAEKHARQESPYRHLLRPKAGGLSFVVAAMGGAIRTLLDVTIVYPEHQDAQFWDFLSGRVSKVVVDVRSMRIPDELARGDYLDDPEARARAQGWVSALWREKDARIESILAETA